MLDDRYTPEYPDLDDAIIEQAKMMIRELHSLLSAKIPLHVFAKIDSERVGLSQRSRPMVRP